MYRRLTDHENPAWPGLVDLFAFSMILVLFLWVSSQTPQSTDKTDLADSLRVEQARIESLLVENAMLRKQLSSTRATLAKNTSDRRRLLRQAILEELNDVSRRLVDRFGPHPEDSGELDTARMRITIRRFLGRELLFGTLSSGLEEEDRLALARFVRMIADLLPEHPALRLDIEGTADPRPVRRTTHPRDNVELSALRAAAVANVMLSATPALAGRVRVAGLGAVGHLDPSVTDPETAYRHYRRVTLHLAIDPSDLVSDTLRSPQVPVQEAPPPGP